MLLLVNWINVQLIFKPADFTVALNFVKFSLVLALTPNAVKYCLRKILMKSLETSETKPVLNRLWCSLSECKSCRLQDDTAFLQKNGS